MQNREETDQIDCFLKDYEAGLRTKIDFIKNEMIPLVIVARALKRHIMTKYEWSKADADIYLTKCNFAIAEEMKEGQIEKTIGIVRLIFDIQMEIFDQIEIDSGIISERAAGITFEMGTGL